VNRTILVAATIALAGVGLALPALGAGPQDVAVYEVTLGVARPGGAAGELRFEVVAGSETQANVAARRSLATLAPGSQVIETSGVHAAWLPWSWQWADEELPVPVAYNPQGAPDSVGPDAIVAGLQAWSNVDRSTFRYQYAGFTDNVGSILESGPDGENVISWVTLDCERGCVLGVTSKESAHEVDLVLNNNPQAAEQLGVGTRVDWRTVILHELGHMAGLEHSCPVPFGPCTDAEADAVMYFQYRGILRHLADDDFAGIRALYPVTSATPTPNATPAPGAIPTPTPFPEFPVVLERGWNLVLLPEGSAASVAEALTCVAAIYTQVEGDWVSFIPGVPGPLQTLTELQAGRAYWVLATRACARFL
jgi:hypothetical protein